MNKIILISILSFFISLPAVAGFQPLNFYAPSRNLNYEYFDIWGDPSLFVQIPSIAGSHLGATTSFCIIIPTGLYWAPEIITQPIHDSFKISFESITGIPFFIAKKSIWDGPIYIWESIFDEEKSNQKPSGNPAPPSS